MDIYWYSAIIIFLLAIGFLLKSMSIKIFNYAYLFLLVLILFWGFFIIADMTGGVSWSVFFVMLFMEYLFLYHSLLLI